MDNKNIPTGIQTQVLNRFKGYTDTKSFQTQFLRQVCLTCSIAFKTSMPT